MESVAVVCRNFSEYVLAVFVIAQQTERLLGSVLPSRVALAPLYWRKSCERSARA